MSLHTLRHQGPHKPSSCTTFMLNSQWGQRCRRQKKKVLCLCAQGPLILANSLRPCRLACQASLSERGILQARIVERTGQYWLPYPSRALYFLLP